MLTRRRMIQPKRRVDSGPSTFDFTAGGLIPFSNCIQAFDPFAIQDLASSYVDLSLNNNQPIVTVPPTLEEGGWLFNGTNQHINTGILFKHDYSVFATYSYLGIDGTYALFGVNGGMYVYPYSSGSTRIYYGSLATVLSRAVEGVVGISGEEVDPELSTYGACYISGTRHIIDSSPFVDRTYNMLIGAMSDNSGVPYRYANCVISRWAIYDIPLSATQAGALTAAMAVA